MQLQRNSIPPLPDEFKQVPRDSNANNPGDANPGANANNGNNPGDENPPIMNYRANNQLGGMQRNPDNVKRDQNKPKKKVTFNLDPMS